MKRLFRFKYLKVSILLFSILFAYLLFSNINTGDLISRLNNFSYVGFFIAGILFAFGFTAPFAVGFFIVSNPSNIYLAAIIGGLGALFSDLFIFKFIRISFIDEFNKLKKTKLSREVKDIFDKKVSKKLRAYLMYIFAGIIISSPLPDEIGVMMLAGLSHIEAKTLAVLSIILNTLGIFLILLIF